jgi:hypothetical protein
MGSDKFAQERERQVWAIDLNARGSSRRLDHGFERGAGGGMTLATGDEEETVWGGVG